MALRRQRGAFLESRAFSRLIGLTVLALNGYVWARTRYQLNGALGVETGPWVAFVLLGMLAVNQFGARVDKFTRLRHLMVVVSGVYLSFLMYFVFSLMLTDLAALFTRLSWTGAYYLALTAALSVSAYGLINVRRVARTDYRVDLGLGKSYKVALLSDLHLGDFVKVGHVRRVVRAANALDADLILIAGDLFNSHGLRDVTQPRQVAAALCALNARDGVYAVYGNHDPLPGDRAAARFLAHCHINLLRDQAVRVGPIALLGRNDYSRPGLRKDLKPLLPHTDAPLVVLDHNPWGVDEAARAGAALVLCGHTHRGQLAPMSFITWSAVGKDYFYGLTRHGDTAAIVTSGAGYFGLPMRVGSRCEVALVTLV